MLGARTRELATSGQLIVQDPRFFSVLTLPGGHDEQIRQTVAGVAGSFHEITGTDLFEVLDARDRTLASVGADAVSAPSRAALVRGALAGGPATGVLVDADRHYLVAVTPAMACSGSWTRSCSCSAGCRRGSSCSASARAWWRSCSASSSRTR